MSKGIFGLSRGLLFKYQQALLLLRLIDLTCLAETLFPLTRGKGPAEGLGVACSSIQPLFTPGSLPAANKPTVLKKCPYHGGWDKDREQNLPCFSQFQQTVYMRKWQRGSFP